MRDDESKPDAKPGAKPAESRRAFLKMASVGSIAAGAAAVAGGTAQAADADEAGGDGYRETTHVKTYYALARF